MSAAVLSWLRAFKPMPLPVGRREIALACLGSVLGLLATEWLARHVLGHAAPWFIAPMGASAVLLFAMPASPLAQPWSIVGGNTVSALVGVSCHYVLGDTGVAAALAGALAIAAMFALRCLHPPGGAVALTGVLGGPVVHQLGFQFPFWPVAGNSLILLLMALMFNNLARRPYPHRTSSQVQSAAQSHQTNDPRPSERLGFSRDDLAAALAGYGELLDIGKDDLEEIFVRAEQQANRRKWGDVQCSDIMSRDVVHVSVLDPVVDAWTLLARHRIKALPVLGEDGRLAGIVSLHDFFIGHDGPRVTELPVMTGAQYVEDIMTRQVRVARPGQAMVDLVGAFSDGGLHHMPVVDDDWRVVGMLTQSDLVAALFKLAAPART